MNNSQISRSTPAEVWKFIYGPPGCGKSALGQRLAESLSLQFYDLDEIIEDRAKVSIAEIFASEGESGFRRRERALLEEVLQREPGIVALGGGVLLDRRNRDQVEATGPVLCLSAPYETLYQRVLTQNGQRPLLVGDVRAQLEDLLERRSGHYASFPNRLDMENLSLEAAVLEAQIRFGAFRVSGMGAGYDVRIRPGGLDSLGAAMRERELQGPVALVSDENVAGCYASRVSGSLRGAGYDLREVIIPPGERYKTMDTVERIWEGFLDAGLERGSVVVALGGGVVGDLTGFAAATFLRGVRWVAVPTSLLAMVDASLGGKTGADLPQGKNLVGAYHPPTLVLADPETLATLPEAELRNGMAEVVKHGVLGDPALFKLCSRGWDALQEYWGEVVRRAMAVKIRIIREDPYEKDRRASLNLGHTLGHAIELASDFRIKHGEAVAIGMCAAALIAENLGIAEIGIVEEIKSTLESLGLPTEFPAGLDRRRALLAMSRDKKRSGGRSRFVLPVRVGEVKWGVDVGDTVTLF